MYIFCRSLANYYPFGMMQPGRQWAADSSLFGFQGQMKDDEVAGRGNTITAEFWEYDTRTGRRWNLDPKPTVGVSMYSAFMDNPVMNTDILGDSSFVFDNNLKYQNTIDDHSKTFSITVLHEKQGPKGETVIEPQKFTLNDQKNDPSRLNQLIGTYRGTQTQFLFYKSENDEKEYLANSKLSQPNFLPSTDAFGLGMWIEEITAGVSDLKKNSNGYDGSSNGKYDFWSGQLLNEMTHIHGLNFIEDGTAFFITGNKAYNDMDYGNRLWGKAGGYMRLPLSVIKWGANYNNQKTHNGLDDDPADQQAIEDGWNTVK